MKKIMMLAVVALSVVACNKETAETANSEKATAEKVALKTAYIDTEVLMKDYQEFKDFEVKFKTMSEKMKNELDSDARKFQNDVLDLQKNAQSKGMEWAQKRQAELERRQQTLTEKEQNYMKKFQEESAVERDSMVSKMKKFIKDYGKEKGYDYIYGTGDAASVLYAKEEYDLTKEILALLHKQYEEKTGKKVEAKEETTTTETKKEADKK
ncbi:OmpH family outer membrane protein [Paenimyroides aestuarii]|uniref:OmpH family outer membrane protein n=1 Tax=Paenimyroides aestuarii TaxID=2968490 RepID=A0ABY5NUX1_9FLAO|nr:OmpH family outer membrane protein [Paenimyroides aestuarii]UUV22361.1 OmpH family outer membrane protein [Paenimyroides aestuarii]